jgi:hypothetical protein
VAIVVLPSSVVDSRGAAFEPRFSTFAPQAWPTRRRSRPSNTASAACVRRDPLRRLHERSQGPPSMPARRETSCRRQLVTTRRSPDQRGRARPRRRKGLNLQDASDKVSSAARSRKTGSSSPMTPTSARCGRSSSLQAVIHPHPLRRRAHSEPDRSLDPRQHRHDARGPQRGRQRHLRSGTPTLTPPTARVTRGRGDLHVEYSGAELRHSYRRRFGHSDRDRWARCSRHSNAPSAPRRRHPRWRTRRS